jgi:hypothetical protein
VREHSIYAEPEELTCSRKPFAAQVTVTDDEADRLATLCSGFGEIEGRWNWNWLNHDVARFYFEEELDRDLFRNIAWMGMPFTRTDRAEDAS